MAWTFLPGVHSSIGQITGPGTAATDQTTNVDITAVLPGSGNPNPQPVMGAPPAPLNAVRTITWADDSTQYTGGFASQTDRINKLADWGMFVVPCFSCHRSADVTPAIKGWGGTTATNWHDRLITWFNKIKDSVTVVEVGNEPDGGDWNQDGTGVYFDRLRAASNILKGIKPSIEVITAGIPTGNSIDFLNALHLNGTTNSIWDLVDGFSLHPYYQNAGAPTYTIGSSNYGPPYGGGGSSLPHMIDWVAARRYQLDHGGRTDAGATVASAQAVDMWVTEFGWHTQNPSDVPNVYAAEGHGSDQQALKMENAYSAFQNHAEELKLRAALWFSFQDYGDTYTADATFGMRRNRKTTGFNHTAAIDWKADVLTALGSISTAPAPTVAPVVQTLPYANLTKNSVQLRGTVNPKGTATTYHFEYQQV